MLALESIFGLRVSALDSKRWRGIIECSSNEGEKMGYQKNCEDYALFGNPERDHWDYEENAQYDRFDGYRDSDPGGYQAEYDYEVQCDLRDREDFRDSMTEDNCTDSRDQEG